MDMLFNPSVTETFGNVTLEAMAAGLPVVAAIATGSECLVNDGVTGRLIRPARLRPLLRRTRLYCRGSSKPAPRWPGGRDGEPAFRLGRGQPELIDAYIRIIRQHSEGGRQIASGCPSLPRA